MSYRNFSNYEILDYPDSDNDDGVLVTTLYDRSAAIAKADSIARHEGIMVAIYRNSGVTPMYQVYPDGTIAILDGASVELIAKLNKHRTA